jgi:polyphosphate kinase
MGRPSLDDPRYYINRHESWLAFNRRVLEEALNAGNPLLERVKFLAITASNLDEFVEVRVAGLLQQVEHGNPHTGPDGLSPEEQVRRLARDLHCFVDAQYACWNQQLLPALRREGIRILSVAHLERASRDAMDLFFTRQVDPILTPVTIDPSHPFPHVLNKALCVAFHLRRHAKPGTTYLGVVTVPRKLARLVRVAGKNGSMDYIFLHDLIETHTRNLYKG